EILTKGVDNKTTGRGEFVLYLKGLKEEDLIDGIFIKGNNGKTVHLKVTHETKSCLFDLEEVKEGQTTSVKEPIILS
ncbi:MAG: hypothetical protein KAT34_06020, partial [Candidatus Aminicenantes bacterium]|nr:hypothetical protein [Candidatus Aminicenantes bacterium]